MVGGHWWGAFQERGAVRAPAPRPGHCGSFQGPWVVPCAWGVRKEAEAGGDQAGRQAGATSRSRK